MDREIKLGKCPASIMVKVDTIFITNEIEIIDFEDSKNQEDISKKIIDLCKKGDAVFNELFELLTGIKDYDFFNELDMSNASIILSEYVKKCQGMFLSFLTVAGSTRAK